MTFDEIPIRLMPGNHLQIRPTYAGTGLIHYPAKVLVVGQKLPAGTIGDLEIVEVTRESDGDTLAGRGSIGAAMVRAYRKRDDFSEVHFVALADAGGAVSATGKLAFGGTFTGSQVIYVKLGGVGPGGARVNFTANGSGGPSAWATAFAAAVNAALDIPVTAQVNGVNDNEVDFTFRHGGECGNDFDIRVDTAQAKLPAGMTATITPMAGGSGNPSVTALLDAIDGQWFTDVVIPWRDTATLEAFEAEARDRYVATVNLDMHVFFGARGTYAQAVTQGAVTNSPFMSFLPLNKPKSPPWVVAANLAAVSIYHLSQNPARQLKTLVLPEVDGPDIVDHYNETENELLLGKGCSTAWVHRNGQVTLARVVTTYTKTPTDLDDDAWLDIMVPKTMSAVRYDWLTFFGLQYPRAQLTDDATYDAIVSARTPTGNPDLDTDNSLICPRVVLGSWAGRCGVYQNNRWLQQVDRTLRKSSFWVSDNDKNRLESVQVVNVMGNQIVLAGELQFEAQA